jgi:hypothetical protein
MNTIPQRQNIVLDYTPKDFFYLSSSSTPDDNMCAAIISAPPDCSQTASTGANIIPCLKEALCQNKSLAEQLYSKQNVHSGEDIRWRDINHQYSFEMLKTLNLLIGIVVSGVFIYYNRQ